MTAGERTSWETTTRSVPLMMNVPLSVIIGKSAMKTVCSLISPVEAFMKRARTKIGAEKVMSFSLHSSTVNLGGGRRAPSAAPFCNETFDELRLFLIANPAGRGSAGLGLRHQVLAAGTSRTCSQDPRD